MNTKANEMLMFLAHKLDRAKLEAEIRNEANKNVTHL